VLQGADLGGARLVRSDLRGADLSHADLTGADLKGSNMAGATLAKAELWKANLSVAELSDGDFHEAKLDEADLSLANLSRANLVRASLSGANLHGACLCDAKLNEANLQLAILVDADLTGADPSGCRVYGLSAWSVNITEGTRQIGLVITPDGESAVMVDDLEVAQFIYLLLDRVKLRNVMDALTRRGVLILGRFSDGGLELLQALAAWLRRPDNGGYLPLLFDFPRPEAKTYTETIRTLAGLARFVIVDLSGPSVPQEITATVDLYEIPFVPILEETRTDWSMFRDFLVKQRVLAPVRFTDQDDLLKRLTASAIGPAEKLIAERQLRVDQIFGRA